MSLIYGNGSFTRYKADGPLPGNYLEVYPKKIARYAFRNLDENSDQERSTGWVNIMDMFDSEFVSKEYFKDPCIALSWRVDVRKVPAKALRQYSREEEEKAKGMEGIEHISKKRKEEIKEAVRMKLMKRAIPRSNVYDMIWNIQTGLVIFGATGSKLCDEFAEFFFNCFAMHLTPVFPYSLASEILEKEDRDTNLLEDLRYSIRTEVD
jgi:DNA recombination-dependent growth factor C